MPCASLQSPSPRCNGPDDSALAGLFLLGSVALAGSDSPILGRSLSINGMTDQLRAAPWVRRRSSSDYQARSKTAASHFVNENAAAEGQLLIAVSNQPLVADSPLWSAVEGAIRFRHKRLFTVSLVGVEAKYVQADLPGRGARWKYEK